MMRFFICVILSQSAAHADAKRPHAHAVLAVVAKSVKGKIPAKDLDGFFAHHAKPLAACAQRAAASNPELSGLLSMEMEVSRDGTVTGATIHDSSLQDSEIESCLTTTMVGLKWPAPTGSGTSKFDLSVKAVP
jgi:hypothetical protein